MRFNLILFFLFGFKAVVLGEWQVVSTKHEASIGGGLVHHHIILGQSAGDERAVVDLAMFSPKSCTVHLIDNENNDRTLAEAMDREKYLAGVNGGYFDPEFKPIGLRIMDGKTISQLRRAKLLTGLVMASPNQLKILRTREFSGKQKPLTAIQCGPFLVDGGQQVRGLDDSHSARRTFVAVAMNDRAALGICSGVTLAELSEILVSIPFDKGERIKRALNLDGGSSTAFWFKRQEGSILSISEQKSVRDFVAVVAK